MNIYYDEEGDFLEITNKGISNCYFNNLGKGIFQIVDKKLERLRELLFIVLRQGQSPIVLS